MTDFELIVRGIVEPMGLTVHDTFGLNDGDYFTVRGKEKHFNVSLFGDIRISTEGGKKYLFFEVDDYAWVDALRTIATSVKND